MKEKKEGKEKIKEKIKEKNQISKGINNSNKIACCIWTWIP